jgi:acyl-CoA thioester hydrolase
MEPASITVRRPLEWMDTDAAGIWHYTSACRFMEHAEHELMRRLGFEWVVGRSPRVRVELAFSAPVKFGEEVATTLTVTHVGRTSLTMEAELRGPSGPVARGRVVSVLLDVASGAPREIPGDLRSALRGETLGGR